MVMFNFCQIFKTLTGYHFDDLPKCLLGLGPIHMIVSAHISVYITQTFETYKCSTQKKK